MSEQHQPAVEYRGVTYAYHGTGKPALENVTLSVREGERLGVLGPNGGGKSTLLKLTLGLLPTQEGTVRVFGAAPREAARSGVIGYVPQKSAAETAFPLSCREVVGMAATLRNPPWRGITPVQRDRVRAALEVVGAAEFAERPVGSLSGGQFQRVMIARALACGPRLLLLDEPTVGIDAAGQLQFAALLNRMHSEMRITLIVVSHDIRTVAAGCDRVACLSRTLHSHVAPGGLTPSVLAEVFRHDVAAMFGDLHVDAHPAAACADPSHHHHGPTP